MTPVIIHLDKETQKIWNKIPYRQKSKTIRTLLRTLQEPKDETNPKHQILKSLSETPETPSAKDSLQQLKAKLQKKTRKTQKPVLRKL